MICPTSLRRRHPTKAIKTAIKETTIKATAMATMAARTTMAMATTTTLMHRTRRPSLPITEPVPTYRPRSPSRGWFQVVVELDVAIKYLDESPLFKISQTQVDAALDDDDESTDSPDDTTDSPDSPDSPDDGDDGNGSNDDDDERRVGAEALREFVIVAKSYRDVAEAPARMLSIVVPKGGCRNCMGGRTLFVTAKDTKRILPPAEVRAPAAYAAGSGLRGSRLLPEGGKALLSNMSPRGAHPHHRTPPSRHAPRHRRMLCCAAGDAPPAAASCTPCARSGRRRKRCLFLLHTRARSRALTTLLESLLPTHATHASNHACRRE